MAIDREKLSFVCHTFGEMDVFSTGSSNELLPSLVVTRPFLGTWILVSRARRAVNNAASLVETAVQGLFVFVVFQPCV